MLCNIVCRINIPHSKLNLTTGTNPKLGIDFEPSYGSGNVFDVTVRNCRFENNENGCANGYTPNGVSIIDCVGDSSVFFRNCPNVRIVNSKFTEITCYGSDSYVDGCVVDLLYLIRFSFTEIYNGYIPNVRISNSKVKQIFFNVATGSRYNTVLIDNCVLENDEYVFDGHLLVTDTAQISNDFIVQNCVIRFTPSEPTGFGTEFGFFYLGSVADRIVFKNNNIYLGKESSYHYSLFGRIRSAVAKLSFIGNKVVFGKIGDGIAQGNVDLFYDLRPTSTNAYVIRDNEINVDGEVITSAGKHCDVLTYTNEMAIIFCRNNIFRGIRDNFGDATIAENVNNFYGDIAPSEG